MPNRIQLTLQPPLAGMVRSTAYHPIAGKQEKNMGKLIDLTGEKFGRWTVLGRADDYYTGNSRWNCICSCGAERVVMSTILRRGESKSCGCLRGELKGEGSPYYKGGFRTRGSLAYFNCKLASSRCSARSRGYKSLAITGEELVELYAACDKTCEGCGVHESELTQGLFIDHDHATGEFRAWLCTKCNAALGLAGDCPEVLLRLADILDTRERDNAQ